MFGKAGLGGLMQQAQKMQENMKHAQAKLADTLVSGEAGNGLVKVVMTCNHIIKSLDISEDLIKEAADDKEMLEDKILVAVNNAIENMEKDKKEKLGKYSNMLNGLM